LRSAKPGDLTLEGNEQTILRGTSNLGGSTPHGRDNVSNPSRQWPPRRRHQQVL